MGRQHGPRATAGAVETEAGGNSEMVEFLPCQHGRKSHSLSRMKKLLLGSLLAGLALFLYGFVSFAVLRWHHPKPVEDEAALAKAITSTVREKGVYMIPGQVKPDGTHRSSEEWMHASADGPYMLAVIRPGASKRPMVSFLAAGLVLNVGLALLLGFILGRTKLGYPCMVKMGGAIGLFSALAGWLPAANWYEYPFSYWGPFLADHVLQGLLAAAIVGKFVVKPGASCS